MKIFWELYYEKMSTLDILQQLNNPLREYENELIEGAIIDIGSGQSSYLLDFAHTDRELIAIDSEQFQLDFLKKRVENLEDATFGNWKFYKQKFPNEPLPDKKYSVIIISNILHFFTLEECIKIGKILLEIASKGTFIFIAVHSHKYYLNDPSNPDNNEYFKHYFSVIDLYQIFPKETFERVYCAEVEKIDSQIENQLIEEWLKRSLMADGIKDPKRIEKIKKEYLQDRSHTEIIALFRKR